MAAETTPASALAQASASTTAQCARLCSHAQRRPAPRDIISAPVVSVSSKHQHRHHYHEVRRTSVPLHRARRRTAAAPRASFLQQFRCTVQHRSVSLSVSASTHSRFFAPCSIVLHRAAAVQSSASASVPEIQPHKRKWLQHRAQASKIAIAIATI